MAVELFAEIWGGDGPIERREYFAEQVNVAWDGASRLDIDIFELINTGRRIAEGKSRTSMRFDQFCLQCVGPFDGVRCYFITLIFQCCDDVGAPVTLTFDLRGRQIEPQLKVFESDEAYSRYAYPSLHDKAESKSNDK